MKKNPGVVAHACNPSIWATETVALQVQDQHKLHSENLPQNKQRKKVCEMCYKNKFGGALMGKTMTIGQSKEK
jgi:hypothetical protein